MLKNVASKMLKNQGSFLWKITFSGYFQWKSCSHFSKMLSWARYEYSTIIRNSQITLVTLLRFSFRTKPSTLLYFQFFLILKEPLVEATFRFCFRKITSNRLLSFFTSKEPLVATFIETSLNYQKNIIYFGQIFLPFKRTFGNSLHALKLQKIGSWTRY